MGPLDNPVVSLLLLLPVMRAVVGIHQTTTVHLFGNSILLAQSQQQDMVIGESGSNMHDGTIEIVAQTIHNFYYLTHCLHATKVIFHNCPVAF